MSQEESLQLLNKHRSVRPISPHLTIYRYPLNMYMSISNRITGAALSAGLYAGAIAYVGLPYLGLGDAVSASSVVGFAAGLPLWAKLGAKTALAVPFAYHTINGVRHLIWDTGRLLSLPKMQVSGITTLVATGLSTVGLVGYGIYW
ncbi:cytochrome b560 subunit of succinate dehydrogenase [Tilletiopsis washingtonensis]|uniref:Cytochrome b560 subunit of succinate dehydrogenase n=1 Tax=Tilletiopsis washingtonensis TaxID=58919 RepID=A0A316Z3A1_9BASI|nr:cytochrome b560 subunit of succinate dehydrogenase [Tilletiopsis washingtonensis]PWN96277.1 cytochrome b560 subunit of succinate dehydrogenase [Tilletiopsis washingtonensis]